jgi:hypothetical protein
MRSVTPSTNMLTPSDAGNFVKLSNESNLCVSTALYLFWIALARAYRLVSVLQACAWTGSCGVNGCSETCVANFVTLNSIVTTSDRAYSEDWYDTCPSMVFLIGLLESETTTMRRLQEIPVRVPRYYSA